MISPGLFQAGQHLRSKMNTNSVICKTVAIIICAIGIILVYFGLSHMDPPNVVFVSLGIFAIIAGGMIGLGMKITRIEGGPVAVEFELLPSIVKPGQVRPLNANQIRQRHEYVASKGESVPGADAPPFRILEESIPLKSLPSADPTTPMYMLDQHFRILDWNYAFNLAFDRSMAGMLGITVLEWVYLLENYQEVIDHGLATFSGNNTPRFDIETIKFKSEKYGLISGTKRAYQVPADDGSCAGWLITIEPVFSEQHISYQFLKDLFANLRKSLIWSEYALSYDNVLNNTQVYPQLLATMTGESGEITDIPKDVKVLDMGAGTGNITRRLLADKERLIVAMENNPIMLSFLRHRCADQIRYDDQGNGVMIVKQDITSLIGISDNYFDFVIMNNVLYSLDEKSATSCLNEVYRVLKPQGEVRISGPQKKTNLKKLFTRIKKEIKDQGRFSKEMEEDFNHVKMINENYLSPMLYKWTVNDLTKMVIDTGFSEIVFSTDKAYAGQAMIVCARK